MPPPGSAPDTHDPTHAQEWLIAILSNVSLMKLEDGIVFFQWMWDGVKVIIVLRLDGIAEELRGVAFSCFLILAEVRVGDSTYDSVTLGGWCCFDHV